jgi:hypothetical protein
MTVAVLPSRRDLDPSELLKSTIPYEYGSGCLEQARASLPSFPSGQASSQPVPKLTPDVIRRVKAEAITMLSRNSATADIADTHKHLRKVHSQSRFIHPATLAGPAELALMLHRIKNGAATTISARDSMLYGKDVPRKRHPPPDGWYPPTDTPLNYGGPYAMQNVQAAYGNDPDPIESVPPRNYPSQAPPRKAAHISFVELDGQQVYKQALAWWITGEEKYANNALDIINAWSSTNKVWGITHRNGPLEAAWGIASMSRALELLRFKQWDRYAREGQTVYLQFVKWTTDVMLKQMDTFVDVQTKNALANKKLNFYNNCKWGRGGWAYESLNRILEGPKEGEMMKGRHSM